VLSDPVLFDEDGVRVTPGWFTHEGTSHVMRTVVRVSLTDNVSPRHSWRGLFAATLVLVGASGTTLWRAVLPWSLGFGLFAASVLVALFAARFAFILPDRRRLEVLLADGTRVVIERPGRAFLDEVHAALLRAMDWHHGSQPATYGAPVGLSAERPPEPESGPDSGSDQATPRYRARSR